MTSAVTNTFIALAAAIGLHTVAAAAPIVLYETGFEAPTFTTGNLSGQDGWTGASGAQYPAVQSALAHTGSQALRIDAVAGPSQYLNRQALDYSAVGNPNQVVRFEADAFIGSDANAYLSLFAVSGNAGFLGQLMILPGGSVTLSGTGNQAFTLNAWHNFVMEMDFSDRTETAWVDGVLIASRALEEPNSTGIAGVLIGRLSGDGGGSMYVDNFSVSVVNGVPEPGTLALAGLSLGVLGMRLGTRKKN